MPVLVKAGVEGVPAPPRRHSVHDCGPGAGDREPEQVGDVGESNRQRFGPMNLSIRATSALRET